MVDNIEKLKDTVGYYLLAERMSRKENVKGYLFIGGSRDGKELKVRPGIYRVEVPIIDEVESVICSETQGIKELVPFRLETYKGQWYMHEDGKRELIYVLEG
jgi:hypothetical protein